MTPWLSSTPLDRGVSLVVTVGAELAPGVAWVEGTMVVSTSSSSFPSSSSSIDSSLPVAKTVAWLSLLLAVALLPAVTSEAAVALAPELGKVAVVLALLPVPELGA